MVDEKRECKKCLRRAHCDSEFGYSILVLIETAKVDPIAEWPYIWIERGTGWSCGLGSKQRDWIPLCHTRGSRTEWEIWIREEHHCLTSVAATVSRKSPAALRELFTRRGRSTLFCSAYCHMPWTTHYGPTERLFKSHFTFILLSFFLVMKPWSAKLRKHISLVISAYVSVSALPTSKYAYFPSIK